MWSRLWLGDSKISALTDQEQGQLVRVMCVANECLSGGHFEVIGIPLSKEQVAEKASVPVHVIEKLVHVGILQKAPFSFKNWEKYQNPDSKRNFIPDTKQDKKNKIRRAEAVSRKPEAVNQKPKSVSENPGLVVVNNAVMETASALAKAKTFR
jgi:hypothetical protein